MEEIRLTSWYDRYPIIIQGFSTIHPTGGWGSLGFLKHQPVLLGLSCPQVMVSSSSSDIAMLSSELGQEMLLDPYEKPHHMGFRRFSRIPCETKKWAKKTNTRFTRREMCCFSLSFLWIFLFNVYSGIDPHCWFPWRGKKGNATQPLAQAFHQEVLHNELLETWDERGLPLENFNVALPAICEAQGWTGCEDLPFLLRGEVGWGEDSPRSAVGDAVAKK